MANCCPQSAKSSRKTQSTTPNPLQTSAVNLKNKLSFASIYCTLPYFQSSSSKAKMSFTDFWKTKAIFIITSPEGIYLHDSIALMVCRLTPTLSASSCCEILNTALSTLMLFFISGRFFQLIHSVIEDTDEQNEKNVNIVERKPKVSKAI